MLPSSKWGGRLLLTRQHLAWPLLPWLGPAVEKTGRQFEDGPSTQPGSVVLLSSQEQTWKERGESPAVNQETLLQSATCPLQVEERSWHSSSVNAAGSLATAGSGTAAFNEVVRSSQSAQGLSWRQFSGIGVRPSMEEVAASLAQRRVQSNGISLSPRYSTAPNQGRAEATQLTLELNTSSSSKPALEASDSSPTTARPESSKDGAGGPTQKEAKGTLVAWRDFEDMGSWVVDESVESLRPAFTKKAKVDSSPIGKVESAKDDAGGHAQKRKQGTAVAWRDFEDMGSWVVDENVKSPPPVPTKKAKVDSTQIGRADSSEDDAGGHAQKEKSGTTVAWRDFEDMGSWVVDESNQSPPRASIQKAKLGGSLSGRAKASKDDAGGDAEEHLEDLGPEGVRDIVLEVVDQSKYPPPPGRAKTGMEYLWQRAQKSGDYFGYWEEYEKDLDDGNWILNDGPIKVYGPYALAALGGHPGRLHLTPKEKKRVKMARKKLGPPAEGEFRLPKERGPVLSKEEMGLSFFELCQLASLRGVSPVDDFLKLSDEDLLRQCQVRTPQNVPQETTKGKRNRAANRVALTHIPTGLTASNDKTRLVYSNRQRAISALQEKIAYKVRRRIPEGEYVPPGRLLAIIPPDDLHPDWVKRKRTRIGPKHVEFPKGAQVLLDLLVCCDLHFGQAAEKLRMTEIRFRRLLNLNIHVKHHVRLYKDLRNQRIIQAHNAGRLDALHKRLVEGYMAGLADKSKRSSVDSKQAESVETEESAEGG